MKFLISSKLLVLPLAGLAFLIMFSFGRELSKRENLQKDLNLLEAEMSDLEKKKSKLKQDQQNLQDPAYIEKEVRERFSLKKPQEELFLILDKTTGEFKEPQGRNMTEDKSRISQAGKSGANQEKNNIIQWWEYFFARD